MAAEEIHDRIPEETDIQTEWIFRMIYVSFTSSSTIHDGCLFSISSNSKTCQLPKHLLRLSVHPERNHGSTRVARRAGNNLPPTQPESNAAMPVNVTGSAALTPYNK